MAGSLPCVGEGEPKKRKTKQEDAENKQNPFDWGKGKGRVKEIDRKRRQQPLERGSGHANGEEKNSNSALTYFLVPDIAIWTPPGSGTGPTGLIPLGSTADF